jgi:uncharacterized cupin superfamily protein
MPRHPRVVNIDEMEWNERAHGERFAMQHKRIGSQAGSKQLGCGLYRVAPGKTAFPTHRHHANDEAVFILRAGPCALGRSVPVRRAITSPFPLAGRAQFVNSSAGPLEYLCFDDDRDRGGEYGFLKVAVMV